jgi:hypothetical protein
MISLASSAISFTITTTSMFKWLRELVSPIHHKLEELIHCPWCLGHYILLGILIIFLHKTLFLDINIWLHLIINWFAALALMGICHYILLRAYEPVAKAMVYREIEKLKKENNE